MSKKYELSLDTETGLYRITALRDFGDVKAGDKGGLIQSEKNLSHDGDCWVYVDARVYEDALVFEDAQVYGDAQVFGDAWVYGDAWVSGDAWVYGGARVSGNAWVFGDARVFESARVSGNMQVCGNSSVSRTPITAYLGKHHILVDDNYLVTIGCEQHPLKDWLENYRKIGEKHGYTDDEIDRHGLFLKLLDTIRMKGKL